MIAAGEVITKPVNVIKELLENSLDAGATNIRITFQSGGLKLIEIIDNGCGISRSDAELLCHRYATSKLNTADDLTRVSTFGFRGEALASISEVADVEVRTFNPTYDYMGWHASYESGNLIKGIEDKYSPSIGTTIRVKNLFSRLVKRKKALQVNTTDEKKAIVDLVVRFAIHHRNKVTMILTDFKPPDLLCVMAPVELGPCIGSIYGLELENNLIYIECENTQCYEARVQIAFSYKQSTSSHQNSIFFIFINDRLVECSGLKHEVDGLIHQFLNMRDHISFVYLSLKVPPETVDVNTHPAKSTVTLESQTEITALIITTLREKLSTNLQSRTLKLNSTKPKNSDTQIEAKNSSQSIIDVISSPSSQQRLRLLAPGSLSQIPEVRATQPTTSSSRPYELVHNDSTQPKLHQYNWKKGKRNGRRNSLYDDDIRPWPGIDNIDLNDTKKRNVDAPFLEQICRNARGTRKNNGVDIIEIDSDDSYCPTITMGDSTSDMQSNIPDDNFYFNDMDQNFDSESLPDSEEPIRGPARKRRTLKLFSLFLLREKVLKNKSSELAQVIKNSIFVGTFDHKYGLIQYETGLYAINLKAFLCEQYYQFYLFDLGNFPPIDILPPGNRIQFIVQTSLDDLEKHEPESFSRLTYKTAESVVEKLLSHSSLLEDYLSITMTNDEILTIPNIVPGEIPNLIFLGRFLVYMANKVDFKDEYISIKKIGKVIANFYSEPPADLRNPDVQRNYHHLIEKKLWPAVKGYLIPPKKLMNAQYFSKITDTKVLYKVFERC